MRSVNSSVQTEETELMLPNINKDGNKMQYTLPMLGTSLHSLQILRAQRESYLTSGLRKCIVIFLCIVAFAFFGFIVFAYYCSGTYSICSIPSHRYNEFMKYINRGHGIGSPLDTASKYGHQPTFEEVVSKDFQFDIEGHDVMVFLHMQKTGGTSFGRHLVNDLHLEKDCICHRRKKKRCTCLRPGTNSNETWLFSRYSTGWKCGLHADWTELTNCVDDVMDNIEKQSIKRRYFYITLLRDPIHRFLSEYRHVRRGATWRNSLLLCNGRLASKNEVPSCYIGDDWSGVSLSEFMACDSNLAINRQTRMLADLSLVNCYDKKSMLPEQRDTIMLASAKANLQRMSYFGLTEFQEISQYLFEETFNLKFNVRFEQYNYTIADVAMEGIEPRVHAKVKELNRLDIELYEFANELLMQRFELMKEADGHFKDHFEGMGKGHSKMSWKEVERNN